MSVQAEEQEQRQGSLDDQEVATLLRTMQAAQFSKSEEPVQPSTEFKPRSLIEIASEAEERLKAEQEQLRQLEALRAAQQKQAEEELARLAAAETASQAEETAQHLAAEASAAPAEQESPEGLSSEAEDHQPLADAVAEAAPDLPMVPQAQMDTALAELEARLRAEFESEKQALEEKLTEQHFQRGFDAGTLAAQSAEPTEEEKAQLAEQEARQAKLVSQFEQAITAASDLSKIDSGALSDAIDKAVLHLASERAGIAISENPDGLASRIRALVDNIRHQNAVVTVYLNPDDQMAMTPWIEQHAHQARNWQLAADPALQQADIRIEVGGIELSDVLAINVSALRETQEPKPAQSQMEPAQDEMISDRADDTSSEDSAVQSSEEQPSDRLMPHEHLCEDQTSAEPETASETQAVAEPQVLPDSEAGTEAEAEQTDDGAEELQAESASGAPFDAQNDTQTDVQNDAKTDAQNDTQTDAQNDAQIEAQTEAQAEAQTEARNDAQTETQTGDAVSEASSEAGMTTETDTQDIEEEGRGEA